MISTIRMFSTMLLALSAATIPHIAPAQTTLAPQVAGELHVYAMSGTSISQTTRHTNGSWNTFAGGDANGLPALDVGAVATISGDQYVLQSRGTPTVNGMYLAILHPDGTWSYPGYVRPPATGDIGAANVNGTLQTVVPDGPTLMHAIRQSNGNWTPFGNIETQAGDIGTAVSAATAGSGGRLQLVTVTELGSLYHTIRQSNGAWTTFQDVKTQAGDPGYLTHVSDADVAGQLQVVVVTSTGAVFHTIRRANGTWTRFGDVKTQIGNPGMVTSVGVASGPNGQLQLVMSTASGGLVHAIRQPNGSWTRYGDVKTQAGNPGMVTAVTAAAGS